MEPVLVAVTGGTNVRIFEPSTVGLKYSDDCGPVRFGDNVTVRSFSVIYADVSTGNNFKTGHHVLIRERTTFGDDLTVGSFTVIDGQVRIGDQVKIESRVYIPTHTVIGSRVFIGPGVVMTNDKYPLRRRHEYEPTGPLIEDDVSIGANATILPGLHIGRGSIVGSGAVVTRDVPEWTLALGNPARFRRIPDRLKEENRALKW